MVRYLKSTKDGWIFEWDEILAKRPELVELTEEEAYPERFIPKVQVEMVVKAKKGKPSKLQLNTEEEDRGIAQPELDFSSLDVAGEAAKGWPK